MPSTRYRLLALTIALLFPWQTIIAKQYPAPVSEIEGSYKDVVVDGNTLFLAVRDAEMGEDDIAIFQTDRQNQPKKTSSYATLVDIHSMALNDGFLFLASGLDGIQASL